MRLLPNIIKNGTSGETSVKQFRLQDNLMEMAKELERQKAGANQGEEEVFIDPLDEALKRSQEILDVAREEARKIKDEAYQEGFDAGVRDGKEEGYWQVYNENSQKMEAERAVLIRAVEESITEMEEEKQKLLYQHMHDLKNIAIAIAEKVMRVSLQSSGDIIQRMIISSTEKLAKTQWAKIYISKLDAELMVEGDAQFLNALSYLSDNIKIIPMEHEEQGTCIIELPKEIIDASISTQMENIRGILNNVQL